MTTQHTPDQITKLQARIAELEAQLYAIGAGGVGQSIKPQIQTDTAQEPGTRIPASVPTGWKLVPMEPTAAMLDAAFDTEVVHTEWGVDAFVENTDEVYGAMLAAAPEAPAQQKPVAHLPCCGYTDTSALQWNHYNGVAQCHNCGQVYAAPQSPAQSCCTCTKTADLHKAPAPAQQEPVAWRVRPFDYGIGYEGVDALTTRKEQCEIWARKGWKVEPLYAAPQPTENLRCKSTQKRLATLWGYEKARQPLTDDHIYMLYSNAMRGYWVESFHHWKLKKRNEAREFARAVEAAHGITGGQQ